MKMVQHIFLVSTDGWSTFKHQTAYLVARQESKSPPRYTWILDEAPRLDSCVRNMPGGDLSGLNRGTRRQPVCLAAAPDF
mmetsp:Transcript_30228/g.40984  ORF Transcript_30228/g.40984 Transcript_30228/m.40984 type:complete len:80 (-) Transcript_30228:279-518(-)